MRFFILFLVGLMVLSCGPSRKELAGSLVALASEKKQNREYNSAKILLDSALKAYPEQDEVVIKAKLLLNKISLLEQEQNLKFIDSVLFTKEIKLKSLMVNFVLDTESGEDTFLIHKRQRLTSSFNRSYIRANVTTRGDFWLSSQYVGESFIHHTYIKAYADGQSVQSEVVKEDGFLNRQVEDEETKWELINFKEGRDNGVADFIAAKADKAVRVDLLGGTSYSIYLEDFDKVAIRDGYEIAFLLKEINTLKLKKQAVKKSISKLQMQ